MNDISEADKRKLLGPYQMIGKKAACEKATICLDFALDALGADENQSLFGVNAANAYNSFDREEMQNMVITDIPKLSNYYYFLHGTQALVDFDYKYKIDFQQGGIQGLNSTELFYGAMKWKIQKKVKQRMISKCPDFKINYQCDYIDDGVQMMHYKYLKEYLKFTIEEYNVWKISINIQKTCIVMKTSNVI